MHGKYVQFKMNFMYGKTEVYICNITQGFPQRIRL